MKKIMQYCLLMVATFLCYSVVMAEDIYDVVLFWGQSNMVGTAGAYKGENGLLGEDSIDQRLVSLGVNEFSRLSKIDKEIVQNYTLMNHVNIPFASNTVYDYKYLSNSLTALTADTKKVGETVGVQVSGTTISFVPRTGNMLYAVHESYGTNMTEYFAKTYYERTGHKVIIVHAANGGEEIAHFLPHNELLNYTHAVDDPTHTNQYIYEFMIEKYKAAIKYMNNHSLTVGNKFYVVFQGETDASSANSDNMTAQRYSEVFNKIHAHLKEELGLQFGIIIETSRTIGTSSSKGVNVIHEAQESLARNNGDIILGSTYSYDTYIPSRSEYTGTVDYDTALNNALLGVCISPVKNNTIHFNAAALSQIGKETALKLTDLSVNVKFHRNINENDTATVSQTFIFYNDGKNRFGYKTDGTPQWTQSGQFGKWDNVGYTLLGWSKKQSATVNSYAVYSNVKSSWLMQNAPSIDLYGVWRKSVMVHFNCNGGTGDNTVTYLLGEEGNAFSPQCERLGYTPLKWSESATNTDKTYRWTSNVTDSWINSHDEITLYAVWEANTYTCSSGKYLPKNSVSCETCPAGSYCLGGTFTYNGNEQGRQLCNALGTGYTSDKGATGSSSCYVNVGDGKYKVSANSASITDCPAGTYNKQHKSYYGASDNTCTKCAIGSYSQTGASSCTVCQASGNVGSNGTSSTVGASSCNASCNKQNVSSWNQAVWNTNNTVSNVCSIKQCNSGYHLSNNNCVANTYTCSSGEYLPKNSVSCETCPAGSYCPGGTFTYNGNEQGRQLCNALGTGYTSDSGATGSSSCYVNVGDGKYKVSANSASITDCPAGTYNKQHKSYYGASDNTCTKCAIGSYSQAGASSCTVCQASGNVGSNGTSSAVGASSCNASCNKQNVSSWNQAVWNTNNTVSNVCSIKQCNSGYHLSNNNCVANSVRVNVNLDDVVWQNSNINISLSTSSSTNTSTFTKKITGEAYADISAVVDGVVYYVWVSKTSDSLNDMEYSGVSFSGTTSQNQSVSLNYYTISLAVNNTEYAQVSKSSLKILKNQILSFDGEAIMLDGVNSANSIVINKEGYKTNFIGWSLQNPSETVITSLTVNTSRKIYANYEREAKQYLVTFNKNGGSGDAPAKLVTYDNSYGELYVLERDNYIFGGWYAEASLNNKVTADTIVKKNYDHTLYAKWYSRLLGDVNDDLVVNLTDVILMLKAYLGIESVSNDRIPVYDINNSSNIDLGDVIMVLKIYLGII